MQIEVRYFADAREAAGCETEQLEVPGDACVGDAVARAIARHPALEHVAPVCRLALNERFANADEPLTDGATVAFLPPVGGG